MDNDQYAFPVTTNDPGGKIVCPGMTLRDYILIEVAKSVTTAILNRELSKDLKDRYPNTDVHTIIDKEIRHVHDVIRNML